MVVHVYAVDCTIENECVAFAGKSYDPSEHPNSNAQVPPEPSVWSGYRINVQKMCGVMNIISPTTAKVIINNIPFDFLISLIIILIIY